MTEIDFVVTWVDGNDPEWIKEKEKALCSTRNVDEVGASAIRFRDWNLMKFWFRGIEKFTPWVHKVYFVTWGHIPSWLNTNHPKLEVIKHEDFISKNYLPTFNSHTIEFNLHRIKGLSEKFVYFNDDTFICQKLSPRFFFVRDLPCDYALIDCLNPQFARTTHYQVNAISVLNERYSVNQIRKRPKQWINIKYGFKGIVKNVFYMQYHYFVGFRNGHFPQSYLKKTFNDIWAVEEGRLKRTTMTSFRTNDNISIWLARYWQLINGFFYPVRFKDRGTSFLKYDDKMLNDIIKAKYKVICINDLCDSDEDFLKWQPKIYDAFNSLLPDKSAFEK